MPNAKNEKMFCLFQSILAKFVIRYLRISQYLASRSSGVSYKMSQLISAKLRTLCEHFSCTKLATLKILPPSSGMACLKTKLPILRSRPKSLTSSFKICLKSCSYQNYDQISHRIWLPIKHGNAKLKSSFLSQIHWLTRYMAILSTAEYLEC